METFKKNLPGLLIAAAVGLAGKLATTLAPGFGAVALAIIIGIIVGNLIPDDKAFAGGVSFAEKKILPYAIMFLGVELQLNLLIKLGIPTIALVVIIVLTTIGFAIIIGKMLGMTREFSLLMGTGNAVCGSSAIAAVSPIVKGKESEIGLSIGVVNLLGTVGIFLLPLMTGALNFDDIRSGALIGGTLQAVGQVVAAGFSVNDSVGNIAVLVKMGRVLMLGPVVILFSWMMMRGKGTTAQKVAIPFFIWGFFAFSLIASFELLPANLLQIIKTAGKWLLIWAMAAIGMRIKFKTLLQFGPQAVVFGTLISLAQIALALTLVYAAF